MRPWRVCLLSHTIFAFADINETKLARGKEIREVIPFFLAFCLCRSRSSYLSLRRSWPSISQHSLRISANLRLSTSLDLFPVRYEHVGNVPAFCSVPARSPLSFPWVSTVHLLSSPSVFTSHCVFVLSLSLFLLSKGIFNHFLLALLLSKSQIVLPPGLMDGKIFISNRHSCSRG